MTAPSSPQWFKSSCSGGSGTECVECAISENRARIRDSKVKGGHVVAVGGQAWEAFVQGVQGERPAH